MLDQFSKQINEFGNSILDALSQVQSLFGKELDVANPIKNSILDLVGNTPLIRLNRITNHIQGIQFLLKAEFLNPTGSLRDRSSLAMIRDAIKKGKLASGGTIVTHGFGSNSISMSWAGRTLGFKVLCFVGENTTQEEINKLSYYGAEVHRTKEDPEKKAIQESLRLGYWYPNEKSNMANPNHHFQKTGPEIYRDLKGKVDYLVSGGGTGGTITGLGRYFKSKENGNTQVILAGWENSVFDLYYQKKKNEFILPEIFDPKVVDYFLAISKEEAVHYQSDLLVKEGIPVGITTGMVVCAAIRFAESLDFKSNNPNEDIKNLVIICPDRE